METNRAERRTPEQWRQIISEQEQSGQTQSRFCEERGIPKASFGNALMRFRHKSEFVELKPSAGWEGEVSFPNGVTVRVRG